MARGRTHSREFKLEVVRQIASGVKRTAQVCREHGLAAFLAGPQTEDERLARRVVELEQFCGQLAL